MASALFSCKKKISKYFKIDTTTDTDYQSTLRSVQKISKYFKIDTTTDTDYLVRKAGKVALITGGASGIGMTTGASGIGMTTAKLFARHGARLVIADIQDKAGSAVCEELNAQTKATYVHCDVTHEPDVEKAVDAAIDLYGKLDIMYNNAGIIGSSVLPIIQSDKSNFEKVMSVNVTGVYLGTKHAARVMIPAKRGSIISTASVASVEPGITPVAYTCSKHAVLGIMRSAAAELGKHSIRVNCVSPNVLPTPLAAAALEVDEGELEQFMEDKAVLKGNRLSRHDVANAALYLARDESKYVSGLNLLIDGAFSVTNPSFGAF